VKRVLKKLTVFVISVIALGLSGFLVSAGSWIYLLSKDLPDPSVINSYRPDLSTEILDTHGRALAYLFNQEHRLWVPLSEISENLQMAVIVAEDDTFFQHRGINYRETWNALKVDLEKGRYARGGSTITQQLAKNIFLNKEKTLERKVKEYFLTREIEKRITKKRILELYLNEVEWGDGIYGAEAASRTYFGKPASQVENHEAALLAAMLPNPKYFNPYIRLERVKKRQQRILRLMYVDKLLTREELSAAQAAPLVLREETKYPLLMASQGRWKTRSAESCPMRLLEEYLLKKYGNKIIYHKGVKIRTALDVDLQDTFGLGIRESLEFLDENLEGFTQHGSASEPWLLLMKLENTPRALVCVEGQERSQILLARLQSSRPPDALYDYTLERAQDVRWNDIVVNP
jgi:monofunctional biosynthetic peptidoglycan transglycosylase